MEMGRKHRVTTVLLKRGRSDGKGLVVGARESKNVRMLVLPRLLSCLCAAAAACVLGEGELKSRDLNFRSQSRERV